MTAPEGRPSARSRCVPARQVEGPEQAVGGDWWTAYGGVLDPVSGVVAFPRGALPPCRLPGCRRCNERGCAR
jgi:hypothetical protein